MATSKISAPTKVITPVVKSNGASTSTVVTDATTIAAASPINNVKDLFNVKEASKITGILGKVNATLQKDSVRLAMMTLPIIANPKAAKERLKEFGKQGVSNVTTYFDQMGGKLAQDAVKNLGIFEGNDELLQGLLGADKDKPLLSDIIKYQKDTVEMTINGTKQVIKDVQNWDPQSISGVANMINILAGNDDLATFLDAGSEFAMLRTLNNTALDMGLYGVIDVILKDRTETKFRRAILLDGLPKAVSNCDISYINLTIDESGRGAVFARCPNILGDILRNFRLPQDVFYPTTDHLGTLLQILDRLHSGWRYDSRFVVPTYNLELFRLANDSSRITLSLDSNLIGPINIAGNYSPIEYSLAFKQCYPYY